MPPSNFEKRSDITNEAHLRRKLIKLLRDADCMAYATEVANVGRGFPDVLCVCPSGYLLLLELKFGNNKMTEHQHLWQREYNKRSELVMGVCYCLTLNTKKQFVLSYDAFDAVRPESVRAFPTLEAVVADLLEGEGRTPCLQA